MHYFNHCWKKGLKHIFTPSCVKGRCVPLLRLSRQGQWWKEMIKSMQCIGPSSTSSFQWHYASLNISFESTSTVRDMSSGIFNNACVLEVQRNKIKFQLNFPCFFYPFSCWYQQSRLTAIAKQSFPRTTALLGHPRCILEANAKLFFRKCSLESI